jgi:hypothetical protein
MVGLSVERVFSAGGMIVPSSFTNDTYNCIYNKNGIPQLAIREP